MKIPSAKRKPEELLQTRTVEAPKKPIRRIRPKALVLDEYAAMRRTDLYVRLYEDGFGQAVEAPFIVVRGARPGPVLGISAAVHGNELNGVKIIHNLLSTLDLNELTGSLICAPIVNVPGYNAGTRRFSDNVDMNHCFPGKKLGRPVDQYAWAFTSTFLPPLTHLIDIHTASEGRRNTFYVRADLGSPEARHLALRMGPEIILHGRSGDSTLRSTSRRRGIVGVTVEAGNPSVFQGRMAYDGEAGILNVMRHLGMIPGALTTERTPTICKASKWIRTDGGGLLETHFSLGEVVEKRQLLATTRDPFGYLRQEYRAPHAGIVIGLAADPVAVPGTRFCHLGQIGEPDIVEDKA